MSADWFGPPQADTRPSKDTAINILSVYHDIFLPTAITINHFLAEVTEILHE